MPESFFMAAIAQLVEPRVVISVVVGSSPISRPIFLLSPSMISVGFLLSQTYFFAIFGLSYLTKNTLPMLGLPF